MLPTIALYHLSSKSFWHHQSDTMATSYRQNLEYCSAASIQLINIYLRSICFVFASSTFTVQIDACPLVLSRKALKNSRHPGGPGSVSGDPRRGSWFGDGLIFRGRQRAWTTPGIRPTPCYAMLCHAMPCFLVSDGSFSYTRPYPIAITRRV